MGKTQKKHAPKPQSERYTLKNVLANYYLVVVFAIFPLFVNLIINGQFPFLHFDNGYAQIRHQKYYFFLIMTAAALIAEIMLLITNGVNENKAQGRLTPSSLLGQLSVTDWAVLAFVLVCALSTLFSSYPDMAFGGEVTFEIDGRNYSHGRNNGLVLMLAYAAAYFIVTRCFRFKEYVFVALAISSAAVYLLAVLNGFYLDPLNMLTPYIDSYEVYNHFMTTIGNKNMFSSHICVTLPVIAAMFVFGSGRLWQKIVYLVSTALGAMAVVVCDSDSVVLGMGAFFAVYIVICSRRPERLKKLMLTVTVMLASIKLLGIIAHLTGDNYKELSAVPSKIMLSDFGYVAVFAAAILTAALYLADIKKPGLVLSRAVPVAVASVFAVAVCAGIGVIVYYSVFDTQTDLGSLEKTLRYNDAWGTHRGIMWNRSLKIFGEASLWEKLFGSGPETLYYKFMPYFTELYEEFGDSSTDAAHNEYINYLVNIGILGLASYLTFVGSALVRGFKAAKENPLAYVFPAAVIAYLAQAVINIALPIATPLFIMFVALCERTRRQPTFV